MKKVLNLAMLTLIFSFGLILAGCSRNLKLTINFNSNGGNYVDTLVYEQGKGFNMPDDPIKEEYTFGGWFTDNETFNNEFTLATIINYPLSKNMELTVYAKWISDNQDEQEDETEKTINSIEVKNGSLKNIYYLGDELDITGGLLNIYYSDKTSEEITITEEMITNFSTKEKSWEYISIEYSLIGEQPTPPENSVSRYMGVTYKDKSVSFKYYLCSDVVSIEMVNSNYLEDFYYYNDFNLNNCEIELKATFKNGDEKTFVADKNRYLPVTGNPYYIYIHDDNSLNPNYLGINYKTYSNNEKLLEFTYRYFKFKSNIEWDYKTVKSAELLSLKDIYINDKIEDIGYLDYEIENEDGTITKSYRLNIELTFEDDTTIEVQAYRIYYSPNRNLNNYLYNSSINTRTAGIKTVYYNYNGQIVPIEYEVLEQV